MASFKLAVSAALVGVAVMNGGGLPSAQAAPSAPSLPPCTTLVIVNCSPVKTKASAPRGYSIPTKPRGY